MPNNKQEQQIPECPYNCPYDPSKEERQDVEEPISECPIEKDVPKPEPDSTGDMTAILRTSDYEGDVHVDQIWDTNFGPKVGIQSEPEYAEVFNNLDWEKAHHKWNSERVTDTEMWEVDLDALMYVCFFFLNEGVDVTIDDGIREAYMRHEEGQSLDLE